MPRSIWKGEISFGLVSIPISLVSVEEPHDLHFHLLDAKTNARVRYQRMNEETGKEVPWNQIVKGYEFEKNNFIVVDEAAFEKASPEVFKSIDINEFVDFEDIDPLYFSKPYYLIPESKNKKAYVLLREALKKSHKVGVAEVIIRTKASLALIVPHEHALILYLIHFQDEIRTEEDLNLPKEDLKTYHVDEKEIKMAMNLISSLSTSWQPEKYHDTYRETLQTWLDQQVEKQSKKTPSRSTKSAEVVDFISLLKQSMKKSPAKHVARKKSK